jgi:hypothetical protein
MAMTPLKTLKLVQESKISALLPAAPAKKPFEASGVIARGSDYFVVFDDRTSVARISSDLGVSDANVLVGTAPLEGGYEGIAYNPAKHRYYLLVESLRLGDDKFKAGIVEYSEAFKYLKFRPLDFDFKSDNKGFEALAHMRRDGQDYALGLCEGNRCESGKKGRRPGNGRVQLFEKAKKSWHHIGTIKLPKSVAFVDYSGLSIDADRVAIVSQENSMMWVGVFERSKWDWRDEGQTYEFPRTADGAIQYGNVEGVSWVSPQRIVTVSDRRKDDQPKHFKEKDQSIHVFDIPGE